jgi:cytoskeletal protein CcmA (bactofilin family)
MWNRKKEEEAPQRAAIPPAAPAPPSPPPVINQGASMSAPAYRPEPEAKGSATIGKNVTVTGQIFSREDLYVDGEVEGTIELAENKLTIGSNGKVKAGIHARDVVIIGSVQGNVEATERVDIRKDARLVGDIRTARIVIEDGAVFKGSIDIVKPEAKAVPPAPKPAAAPAAAAPVQPALSEVKR